MTAPDPHSMSGRRIDGAGSTTYCRCGLAFHESYPGGIESGDAGLQAMRKADARWAEHATRGEQR